MAAGIPSGLAGSPARRRHGARVEALARGSRTAAGASGQAGVLSNSPEEVETAPGEARTLVQRAQPPGAAPPAIQTPSHPPDVCSLTVAFSKVFAASLEIKCTGPGKENRESYGTYEGRRERESLGWEKLTGLFPPAWIIQEKCAGSCPRSTQKVKHTGCAWTIRQCETCSDHFRWLHTPGERLRCPNCELPEGCANVRPRPLLCPQLKHIWPSPSESRTVSCLHRAKNQEKKKEKWKCTGSQGQAIPTTAQGAIEESFLNSLLGPNSASTRPPLGPRAPLRDRMAGNTHTPACPGISGKALTSPPSRHRG
ncbi:uncharacterized protein LOC110567926 [Aotus nancymaae]|uniref:uncharacterized protein LOC110567926 n=1 Tax=Aotus nancymaae TaxID=37293 RepID=UPI0030FF2073